MFTQLPPEWTVDTKYPESLDIMAIAILQVAKRPPKRCCHEIRRLMQPKCSVRVDRTFQNSVLMVTHLWLVLLT
jgi:hypothetical protein